MANAITIELLNSQKGAPNGIATLDGTGKIPVAQLPASAVETYKGEFATSAALTTAFPTGATGDYAYVTATGSYWYWNSGLTTPAWVNGTISLAAYLALTPQAQARVDYILTP